MKSTLSRRSLLHDEKSVHHYPPLSSLSHIMQLEALSNKKISRTVSSYLVCVISNRGEIQSFSWSATTCILLLVAKFLFNKIIIITDEIFIEIITQLKVNVMLSEKKAINSLKPWWDVAFHYSLWALICLGIITVTNSILIDFEENLQLWAGDFLTYSN